MNEIIVNEKNYESEVLNSKIPVLIDFWATWCGPCRMLAPELSSIAEKYNGKIKVAKINVDENENIAARFEVRSIPALYLIDNKKIVKNTVGYINQEQIEEIFNLKQI